MIRREAKQRSQKRMIAASRFSYQTPKGYCETRSDLLKLYPSFTKNTLIVLNKDAIISKKFVSMHPEFRNEIGKTFSNIGIVKINRKQ